MTPDEFNRRRDLAVSASLTITGIMLGELVTLTIENVVKPTVIYICDPAHPPPPEALFRDSRPSRGWLHTTKEPRNQPAFSTPPRKPPPTNAQKPTRKASHAASCRPTRLGTADGSPF